MRAIRIQSVTLFLAGSFFFTAVRAQQDPAAQPGPSPVANPVVETDLGNDVARFSFDSYQIWSGPRSYVIGRFLNEHTIKWLGGGETKIAFKKPECDAAGDFDTFHRAEFKAPTMITPGASRPSNLEVLYKSNWVAIEVSPTVKAEVFLIRSPRYRDEPNCEIQTELEYDWNGGTSGLRPITFQTPTTQTNGHEITIYAPEKAVRADLQLDLYLGFTKGSFPNAVVNPLAVSSNGGVSYPAPKTSLVLVPVAVARGEWLFPYKKDIGFTLGLEQTLQSFGGQPSQAPYISDWVVGTFYQKFFGVLDGLQARLGIKYFAHSADQGTRYFTIAEANQVAKGLIIAGTVNQYFGQHWLLGADLEYGLNNSIAGRGVQQSYLAYYGRVGFRVTSFMLIIYELGLRNYEATGLQTETLFQNLLGIRLDL